MTNKEAIGIIYNNILDAIAILAVSEDDKEADYLKRYIEASDMAIKALSESEWCVITSDEEGTLYCLPDEGEEVILSYNGCHVWIDTLESDIHGVYFDNYGGIEEGMAWKYAIPYKEK